MKKGDLYRFIDSSLTYEELAELCRMLDVDIENLSGNTRKMKALSLEDYLTRRGRLDEAVPAMAALFPDLDLTPLGGRSPLPREAFTETPENTPSAPPSTPPPPAKPLASSAASRVERLPYENFDIHVRAFGSGQYTVEVTNSPVGETPSVLQSLPLDDAHGQAWIKALREGLLEPDEAEAMGRALYTWLFPEPVDKALHAARATTRYLRIRIRIDSSEISRLPWEFVFHPDDRYLALNPELPIVRYPAEGFAPTWDRTQGAVRLLAVGASPPDYPPLDVEGELERLAREIERSAGRIHLTPLPHATPSTLQQALREGVDVFHFIGHGMQRREAAGRLTNCLVLEGEGGTLSRELDADKLHMLLQSRNVKLAVLNACSSAQSDSAEVAMGLAPALVRARVPAVIAMQARVSDRAASLFSGTFYELFARRFPIDTAVVEARQTLYIEGGEWGTPVLFMRAPDGILWTGMDAPEATTSAPRQSGVTVSGISNSSISIGGSVVGGDLTQGR